MTEQENLRFFDEEIRPLYGRLMNYISTFLWDRSTAEDITQDVMALIWEKIELVKEADNVWAYVSTMAANRVKNYWRTKCHRVEEEPLAGKEELLQEKGNFDIGASICRKEDRKMLMEAIGTLRPLYRTVIVCYYFYELPLRRVAETLDLPYGSVVSVHSRAKQELKRELEQLIRGKGGV